MTVVNLKLNDLHAMVDLLITSKVHTHAELLNMRVGEIFEAYFDMEVSEIVESDTIECPTCKGRKQMKTPLNNPHQYFEKCWDCKGTGRVPKPCPNCMDGTVGALVCPVCNGSAKAIPKPKESERI